MLLDTLDEGGGCTDTHDAGDDALVDVFDGVHLEQDVGHMLPRTTVGTLVESFVFLGVAIEPGRVVLDEVDDALVEFLTGSPVEPFLHGGLELVDVESAHEGRVEVGELVFLTLIHG